MSCECKKKCDKNCLCASNDLKCTDMCSCNNCDNETPIDETMDLNVWWWERRQSWWIQWRIWFWILNLLHFFDINAIYFLCMIYGYFLAFLRISSILDFSNFKASEMESDKSWKRCNELGYKDFSGLKRF